MLIAKRSAFLTAIIPGALILLLTSCSPAGDTERQLNECRADVDRLEAELQRLNGEIATLKGASGETARARRPEKASEPDQASEPNHLSVGKSTVLGSESAPVTMFSYNDYNCSDCAVYATEVLPYVLTRYVDSGSLRIVMREFPDRQQGKKALRKSRLAICAGRQEKYLEMHDWLYTNSKSTREDLQAFTGQLDLDQEEFRSCMRDPELSNQVRANLREATQSAIQSPPGFLLGLTDQDDPEKVKITGHVDGPPQLTDLQTAIDELLTQAGASN